MYSQEMYGYGAQSSAIRELFAYGMQRKAQIGAENVFDFSLGNPSVPPPKEVNEAIIDIVKNEPSLAVHGYTAGPGDAGTRQAIADDLNERYNFNIKADGLYITCGAAAALKIILCALYEEGDEVLCPAPFFPEYRVFSESAGYRFTPVMCDSETLQPDIEGFRKAITGNTKLIIVDSPNNPSGVIYTEEHIKALADLLRAKEEEYGHPIFLVSDEPYRELAYGREVPFIPSYYDNTILCYSYSKSLSMPGERIGYVCVSEKVAESRNIYLAVCGAGRALGYVCAPSLLQQVVRRCAKVRPDLEPYKVNRDILYNALTKIGYTCIYPDGAFYMFVKALEEDAAAFHEKAKEHELLLVPGDSFGAPGFVRISYCVDKEMIEKSIPAFAALYEDYRG